jgi:hypothetical protein
MLQMSSVVALASSWPVDGLPLAPSDSAQIHPVIATDGSGGAFVAWSDSRLGPKTTWIQRVTPSGEIVAGWPSGGLAALIRQAESVPQTYPVVAADGEGGVGVVAGSEGWYGPSYVGLTRIGPFGAVRPSWPAGGTWVYGGSLESASAAPGGGSAAAVIDVTGSGRVNLLPSVRFEPPGPFDHDGSLRISYSYMRTHGDPNVHVGRIGPGTPAFAAPWPLVPCGGWANQYQPLMCTDGAGGDFVVWWQPGSSLATSVLKAVHVQANGTLDLRWPSCGAPVVDGSTGQSAAGVIADGTGGFYVAFQDIRGGSFERTYLQRFKGNGTSVDGWPAGGLMLSPNATAAGIDRVGMGLSWRESSIVPDGTGGAFVAWTDLGDDAGDIRVQRITANGVPAAGWPAGGIAVCRARGAQSRPTIATDGGGGIFIAWQDSRDAVNPDIYLQRITAAGTVADGWTHGGDPVVRDPYRQESPVVVSDGAGDAIVAWVDWRSGTPGIYAGVRRPGGEAIASNDRHGANVLGGPRERNQTLSLEWAHAGRMAGRVTVRYSIRGSQPAWLRLMDPAGRVVASHRVGAGAGEYEFAATGAVSAGVYFVQLQRGPQVVTTKVVLFR